MKKTKQPQLTALALALTSALASMVPLVAHADQTISGPRGQLTITTTGENITVDSSGAISTTYGAGGITNNGTIVTLSNNGSIRSSGTSSRGIDNNGTIGILTNSGIISADSYGIFNNGTIGTLTNSGTISADSYGIFNKGTITTLSNANTINSMTGIISDGTITTLSNNATINGTQTGIENSGSITTLSNNSGATISGNNQGISNTGIIGTLSNSGIISGGNNFDKSGIYNTGSGSITTLSNSGTISGIQYALYNGAGASLGTITNSGTIAGGIRNLSSHNLTFNGGSGSVFGTLSGLGGAIGTITNTASNVIFASGNQILNDHVNVGSSRTVQNAGGTLQVNTVINITGNYTQAATATLAIGVADNAVTSSGTVSDTGYGRILVSGSATIAAGSTVALKKLNNYGFAQGQRYIVMQAAASGTDYHADSLIYKVPGYTVTGQSIVDGSKLDLLLTLGSANSVLPVNSASTPDAVSSLSGLFNYSGTDADLMNLFNAGAALGTAAAANRAGAQLSPASTAAAGAQVAAASTGQVLNVAAAHVDSLRVAQAQGSSGVATGESVYSPAAWAQVFGGRATQDQRDGISGYHANYSGLLLGSDTIVSDNWRAGGLISYAHTAIENKDDNAGSNTRLNSYGLIGYASYTGNSWYANMSAGAVLHRNATLRAISFPGFSDRVTAHYNSLQYTAALQAGYPLQLNVPDTVLTPMAGLVYSTMHQDGYTESGGNGAALQVHANSSSSLKSELGAKLERSVVTTYGRLTPSVQLSWRHEYLNTRLQSVANYAADTSGATSFTSLGPTPVADTGVLAIGATLMRTQYLTLSAKYTLEAGAGYAAQTADLRLRYQF